MARSLKKNQHQLSKSSRFSQEKKKTSFYLSKDFRLPMLRVNTTFFTFSYSEKRCRRFRGDYWSNLFKIREKRLSSYPCQRYPGGQDDRSNSTIFQDV